MLMITFLENHSSWGQSRCAVLILILCYNKWPYGCQLLVCINLVTYNS